MDKSVPRVTVWHHSAEPRDAKTMILGPDLSIRTSHSCKILIYCVPLPTQLDILISSFKYVHNMKTLCAIII